MFTTAEIAEFVRCIREGSPVHYTIAHHFVSNVTRWWWPATISIGNQPRPTCFLVEHPFETYQLHNDSLTLMDALFDALVSATKYVSSVCSAGLVPRRKLIIDWFELLNWVEGKGVRWTKKLDQAMNGVEGWDILSYYLRSIVLGPHCRAATHEYTDP
ncbi:hypothetical protein B0T14DRAFT_572085 [Immersiella caudata]|uniref:Uncharacterized protein n=1 Tax=Immersiella caudata TaxID=314043 RepID=A0AA39U4J1_9PEZI|nr:hypothetical protein B0T14DRAFT_572085 [Immersiella caudata]